ncbi:hypothetical protein PSTG_11573 [Puccinia striiformis f. sp. tritici PST-78]|uniref:Uncharacterized protein n=2 Tax=Puccinia striiformis f. sp. tritici TaxID=168172 RepID=A0A0L0V7E3_9BASI|nr:hypothetical protein PSTG_11573 [Puccinia striiformis f. sp. tritici PST-78]
MTTSTYLREINVGAWLTDSLRLEFRLPSAPDVRETVESTSRLGRPDTISVHGFFGSRNSKTRRNAGVPSKPRSRRISVEVPVIQGSDKELRKDGEQSRIPSFKDVLSRVPAVREDELIVITTDEVPNLPVVKSDKEMLKGKIMEASAAGDKSSATLFFRLYEQLCSGPATLKPPMNLSNQRSVSSDAALPGQTSRRANSNSVFVSGALPGHMEIGFTPYFDKSLKNLNGIIPLTIFDKEWQEDCMNNHMLSDKKEVKERNGEYVGYAYPNK